MSSLLACEDRVQTQWASCCDVLDSTKFLPFKLQDYYRSTWVSDAAKSIWQCRMQRIGEAWKAIEVLAVSEGLRRCCLVICSQKEFLEQGKRWIELGLAFSPVAIYGVPKDGYSSTVVEAEDGKPIQFRLVLGKLDSVQSFVQAFERSDDSAIGAHLGYPECCRQFFQHVWVERNLVDTSWAMALNSGNSSRSENCVTISNLDWRANILWRWMGARPVFHLPCRFDCQPTIEVAQRLVEIGENHGYKQEMKWLEEILSWPVEWTALHGIAEIKTPVMKVSTRTDATAFKLSVRVQGTRYPNQGAQGLAFPFNFMKPDDRFTNSTNFRRGLDNPIVQLTIPPRLLSTSSNSSHSGNGQADKHEISCKESMKGQSIPNEQDWLARDNGFDSNASMDQHHSPIIRVAAKLLSSETLASIIDLGCGNGALLAGIVDKCAGVVPFGIDSSKIAIEHAQMLQKVFDRNFIDGDMFENTEIWADGKGYTLALLMPGRLMECNAEQASRLRRQLRLQCKYILAYAYGDWLSRYEGLTNLLEKTGFVQVGKIASSPGVPVEVSFAEVAYE